MAGVSGFNTGAIITGQIPSPLASQPSYSRYPVMMPRNLRRGIPQATGASYYARKTPLFGSDDCGCGGKPPVVNVTVAQPSQRRDGDSNTAGGVVYGDDDYFLSGGTTIPPFSPRYNSQSVDPVQDKLSHDEHFVKPNEIFKAIIIALISGAVLYWLRKYAF